MGFFLEKHMKKLINNIKELNSITKIRIVLACSFWGLSIVCLFVAVFHR
jgi:hypothetical protein